MLKVSVIIPVYNVEAYLKRCLDSVCNQTLKDIEIILIDDCSTDGSLEILKDYASKDERIKLITLTKNQGVSIARNKGLEIAKGEYIGFVDSDDTLDLNFYEELYKKAKEKDADIVKCEIVQHFPDGTAKKGNMNSIIKSKNKFYFFYEFTSAIYRASLIFENEINFPAETGKIEDVVFLNKVILKAKSVELVDNVCYHYFRREDSLDADKISVDNVKSGLMACEYVINNINEAFNKEIFKDDYLYLYITELGMILNYLIARNDTTEAKRLCIEKFIKLYNECKIKSELSKSLKPIYGDILDLIENNNVEELIEIFIKYKDAKQYFFAKLKSNIRQDLTKTEVM